MTSNWLERNKTLIRCGKYSIKKSIWENQHLSLTSPAGYSKEDYGQSWSSQEWKSGVAARDRSGKLDEISWNAMQQVRPHHEEPLLDGNAQSVRYGEIIYDGSGQPETVDHQEEANSENFVMGSDVAEFVNKVIQTILSCGKYKKSLRQLFQVTQKLITDQTEITTID